jgi:alkylhydroperoxidase family enzyme
VRAACWRRGREAIALAVGEADNCSDCQFTNTIACQAAGWTPDQIVALRAGAQIAGEEKITALLAVARQAAGNAGDVDKDTWYHALQSGWTTEELAELFTHVIANIFTSYFNHYACPEPDTAVAPALTA